MSIIPPFVENLVISYFTQLLDWFSKRIYVDLTKRASDHLLVKLNQHLDLIPLEEACAPFHHSSGRGRPPEHTVSRLVGIFDSQNAQRPTATTQSSTFRSCLCCGW